MLFAFAATQWYQGKLQVLDSSDLPLIPCPTSCYYPYKWPYKWVTGVISPRNQWSYGPLLITGRDPSLGKCGQLPRGESGHIFELSLGIPKTPKPTYLPPREKNNSIWLIFLAHRKIDWCTFRMYGEISFLASNSDLPNIPLRIWSFYIQKVFLRSTSHPSLQSLHHPNGYIVRLGNLNLNL